MSEQLDTQINLRGYLHQKYAESFKEFGTIRALPRSKGWMLIRSVPNCDARDAMGLYPLFCCADWEGVKADLDELGAEVVCAVLVTDPFSSCDEASLRESFEIVSPFKQHFVTDLQKPLKSFLSRHHLRHARNALKVLSVEVCPDAKKHIEDWIQIYSCLSARHNIKGIRRFSAGAFGKQFEVPGLVVFRAIANGVTVGMDLWYMQGEAAYNHLLAVNEVGYEMHASYALQIKAIEHFSGHVRWLNFGGVAGAETRENDGLRRFKSGWSTEIRTSYLCGRVFQRTTYEQVVACAAKDFYFPAYRAGEF
jgi:hypothetical protein